MKKNTFTTIDKTPAILSAEWYLSLYPLLGLTWNRFLGATLVSSLGPLTQMAKKMIVCVVLFKPTATL